MGPSMSNEPSESIELRHRIEQGDGSALIELFARHRDRLKRMVKLRLDRRLQGRIDPSDVLQEATAG
jgi:RNA polymerase sigma-70 factor (ECF subfamily)